MQLHFSHSEVIFQYEQTRKTKNSHPCNIPGTDDLLFGINLQNAVKYLSFCKTFFQSVVSRMAYAILFTRYGDFGGRKGRDV